MTKAMILDAARLGFVIAALAGCAQRAAGAQSPHHDSGAAARPQRDTGRMAGMSDMAGMADHVMSGTMDENMMKHMELTPPRVPTHDDTVRATKLVGELRDGIARYQDTTAAVRDGYRMFLPNLKTQREFHFTNNARALVSLFHFDAAKPTSLLYKPGADGQLHLIGAMYTLGKNASLSRLNDRVPLSIARWHKHVNWCLPRKGDSARWTENKNGEPLFGPESPIATKAECDAVNGDFHAGMFGWMLHANVFAGHDLGSIFADPQ